VEDRLAQIAKNRVAPSASRGSGMRRPCRLIVSAAVGIACSLIVFVARADPTVLRFGVPTALGTTGISEVMRRWAKEVDETSGGTLQIQFFAGGTVVHFGDVLDRLLDKVVDIGFDVMGDYPSQFPHADAPSVPFECTKSSDCSVVMWRLYESGITASEFAKVKPLALFTIPSASLQTTKLVKAAEDLKGLKLIATGRTLARALILMGAAPVTLSPSDYFQAVQSGVADGIAITWNSVATFKIQEVTKYHLGVPFGSFPAFVFMNKDSYAALSDQARSVIDETTGEKLSRAFGIMGDKTTVDAITMLEALPGHVVTPDLPPDEAARWKKMLAPVTEEWIKETPDGAKVLAAHRAELAEVMAGR
jgi:TRAP-type C4-dicarboxylate transport system substrate-binding protein